MTVYKGRGGLSGEEQEILYCVVTRLEIGKVKAIVRELDAQRVRRRRIRSPMSREASSSARSFTDGSTPLVRSQVRTARPAGVIDVDDFQLRVEINRRASHFPETDARRLHPAEGNVGLAADCR